MILQMNIKLSIPRNIIDKFSTSCFWKLFCFLLLFHIHVFRQGNYIANVRIYMLFSAWLHLEYFSVTIFILSTILFGLFYKSKYEGILGTTI